MAEIDCIIEDPRWQGVLEPLAGRAGQATLDWLGLDADIAILGCDDARIAALNADFRGKPSPTNVLSWPEEEPAPHPPGADPARPQGDSLGDIAIAYDTCQREASEQAKPFDAHVTHLLVHGVLHLAGYDHIDDADAETMEGAERSILAGLGLPDPYQDIDG